MKIKLTLLQSMHGHVGFQTMMILSFNRLVLGLTSEFQSKPGL